MSAPRIVVEGREYVRSGGTWADAQTHLFVPLALASRIDALARTDRALWERVCAWDGKDTRRPQPAAARPPGRGRGGCRQTHCWRCAKRISDFSHARCEECNWIQCDCGACGCDYWG